MKNQEKSRKIKKNNFIFLVSAILLIAISCSKEIDNIDQGESIQDQLNNRFAISSDNESELLSMIDDDQMSCFDKGNRLISQENLSSAVCDKLIDNAANFDPFVLEVVFASQNSINENTLLRLIRNTEIESNTLFNILVTHTPLSDKIIEEIISKRPEVNIQELKGFDNYEKLICLCSNTIIFSEKIITTTGCNSADFMMENAITRPLFNEINNENQERMASGCGGKWTCGEADIHVKDDGLGGTITLVNCIIPPNKKCVKKLSTDRDLGPNNHANQILNNSNWNDFKKGQFILNLSQYSPDFIFQLINNACNINPFVFETIMLTSDNLSEDHLKALALNKNVSDQVLSNILIVNSPFSSNTQRIISSLRTNIDMDFISSFSQKNIYVALCCQKLIVGDQITRSANNKGDTELLVYNEELIPFATTSNQNDIEVLLAGCNDSKFICGELRLTSGGNDAGYTKYVCYSPPSNVKCLKLAK